MRVEISPSIGEGRRAVSCDSLSIVSLLGTAGRLCAVFDRGRGRRCDGRIGDFTKMRGESVWMASNLTGPRDVMKRLRPKKQSVYGSCRSSSALLCTVQRPDGGKEG